MNTAQAVLNVFFVVVVVVLIIVLIIVTCAQWNIIDSYQVAFTSFTILLALIYITIAISWSTTNPTTNSTNSLANKVSTITYTSIGKRGDTGNQMFQIACAVAAADRSNAKLVLPTTFSKLPIYELFDLKDLRLQDVQVDNYYREQDNYEHIIVPSDGLTYDIRGYRQATKYFDAYAIKIRQLFTPKAEHLEKMRAVLPQQYIAVHIRRGDYVKAMHKIPLLREFRRCQLAYYQAAIKLLRKTYPSCPILICTDSTKWVQSLLTQLDTNAILAPIPVDIKPKIADFCTLYLANSIVISNSTYSWWAAYLNNKREIIAPTPWWDPDGFIGTAYRLHGNWLHFPEMQLLDADTGEARTVENITDDTEPLLLYKLIRGMLI